MNTGLEAVEPEPGGPVCLDGQERLLVVLIWEISQLLLRERQAIMQQSAKGIISGLV